MSNAQCSFVALIALAACATVAAEPAHATTNGYQMMKMRLSLDEAFCPAYDVATCFFSQATRRFRSTSQTDLIA
jgi:hypothetical protein